MGAGGGGIGHCAASRRRVSRVRSIACLRTKKAPSQSPSNHAQTRSSSGRAEQNRRLKYRYTGECFQRRIAHPGLHEYAENKTLTGPVGAPFTGRLHPRRRQPGGLMHLIGRCTAACASRAGQLCMLGALKARPSHPTNTKTQAKKRIGLFKTQKNIHWPLMRCGPVRHGAARRGAARVCVRA